LLALLTALLLGLGTGFVGTLPMTGPTAALVLQRLLQKHAGSAFLCALGGATADGLYALAVGLPLPFLLSRFETIVPISRAAGAIVAIGLGLLLLLRPRTFETHDPPQDTKSFLSGLALTGLNPTLLATWLVSETTLLSHGLLPLRPIGIFGFAVGVFAGNLAAAGLLIVFFPLIGPRLGPHGSVRLMRVMGAVLVVAGSYLGYLALTFGD
jgi:threonine/homoserine/homoserine lactone efflux protein